MAGGYRGFARDGRPYSPEEWPIWRVLARHGESRAQQAPRPPANRYEYAQPGELVHLDAKKLGRFWQVGKHVLGGKRRNPNAGWQHAHVAVDDHSRWAMVELRPAEDAESCTSFLSSVISAYSEQGITIRRVMTDNGAGYRSRRFRALVAKHGIRHIRTKPYTPRTNGKAEAFIRILQREYAYAFAYPRGHRRPPTHHPHLTRCGVLRLARHLARVQEHVPPRAGVVLRPEEDAADHAVERRHPVCSGVVLPADRRQPLGDLATTAVAAAVGLVHQRELEWHRGCSMRGRLDVPGRGRL